MDKQSNTHRVTMNSKCVGGGQGTMESSKNDGRIPGGGGLSKEATLRC